MKTTRLQPSRYIAAAIILAAPALTTLGCATAPSEDWKTTHTPVWTVDAMLLGKPLIAGDVVLAYVAVGDGKEAMIAWDVADGSELWRHTTLPGRTPPGVTHGVAALEGEDGWQVSVLVPASPDAAPTNYSRVAIFDARTGESLADPLAERGVWAERPSLCGKENDQFCLEGILEPNVNEDYDRRYVYSAEDPEFRKPDDADAGYFDGGFGLTDHVSISDDDTLEYGDENRKVWSRAYDDIFGKDAQIEGGWSWYDADDDQGAPLIGVGATYEAFDHSVPQNLSLQLADGATVRLDRSTGDTVWSVDAQTCALTDWRIYVTKRVTPLCRYESGTIDYRWNGESPEDARFTDVNVELVGIDTDTGATRWAVPLGDAGWNGRVDETTISYATAGASVIASVRGRVTIIDVASGSQHPLSDGEYVLCNKDAASVKLTSIWEVPNFLPTDAHELCNATGDVVEATGIPTAAFVHAGYDPTAPVALQTPSGLSLYAPATPESSSEPAD